MDKRDKPTLVRTVTDTTVEAFLSYIKLLKSSGFKLVWRNQIENNLYFELCDDNRIIYTYFMANNGTARFIEDHVSERLDRFGGGEPKPNGFTAICQFGLYYTPDYFVYGVRNDCGMFYIIKLPDNSLFLIDGGQREQATDAAAAEALRVMRELSETPDGQKIRIAAWFCTHAHDDHVDMFGKLLRVYQNQFEVERAIFNLPSQELYSLMPQTYVVLDRLKKYFPYAKYLKPYTGQNFELAGVKFEFLQTHEAGTRTLGTEKIGNFNDTSAILKISFEGVSFIFLGDMSKSGEALLLSNYGEKTLKSTGVQVAHHLIYQLENVYNVISPDIALVPQHEMFKTNKHMQKYEALCRSVPEQSIYFAGSGTDIFREENGRIVRYMHFPVVGGEFENSEV